MANVMAPSPITLATAVRMERSKDVRAMGSADLLCRHSKNRSIIILETLPSSRWPTRAIVPPTCPFPLTVTTVWPSASESVDRCIALDEPGPT